MNISEINEIFNDQKTSLEKQERGLPRNLLHELPDIKSHALIINGIRRCGKSTLLRQFLQKLARPFFYFNFDEIRLAAFEISDYRIIDKIIVDTGANILFFDEIQSAPKWELYIRQKLDQGYQVLITGSNSSLLSREYGTTLTGRHITKELYPFSYDEYCVFNDAKPGHESLINYIENGGFPEFLKTNNIDVLNQLQIDILYRDIISRYGIRDASSLRRLFVYLVSNPAQLFSPSKLTNIAGVKSHTTVLEYISYFESAYLINVLSCFSYSIKSQNLSPKKIFITDPGIIKTASVSFSKNYGALLENIVFNFFRIKSGLPNSVDNLEIFYFTSKNKIRTPEFC